MPAVDEETYVPRLRCVRGYMFVLLLPLSLTNPAQPDYVE